MFKFTHYNINVLDLEKSLNFYEQALNLKEQRRVENENFTLVYLTDNKTEFTLELTHLKERKEPYNLGENEFHLAFTTENFENSYKKHKEMNCICYENKEMGIYFITDPDNYWIEIIPNK